MKARIERTVHLELSVEELRLIRAALLTSRVTVLEEHDFSESAIYDLYSALDNFVIVAV